MSEVSDEDRELIERFIQATQHVPSTDMQEQTGLTSERVRTWKKDGPSSIRTDTRNKILAWLAKERVGVSAVREPRPEYSAEETLRESEAVSRLRKARRLAEALLDTLDGLPTELDDR